VSQPKPIWERGTFCSGSGDCVEVGMAADRVLVRDSADPGGGMLRFSRREWASFVAGVKAGQFDLR
jgi:hypothetical protein